MSTLDVGRAPGGAALAGADGRDAPSAPLAEAAAPHRHYAALDGLRGFAAVSVVLFHLGHWLHIPGLAANSGLAVDFFFCLSGYVLALAYQERLRTGMTTARFLRVRLIRLMPLIVLATLVSFAFAILRPAMKHEHFPLSETILALALGLVNLPLFGAPKAIGGPQVFPLNGPQYSLFLEIAVNLFWSATRRFGVKAFAPAVAALALAGVLWLGFGGDDTATFWRGLPRVALSFYLGVVAFQLERRIGGLERTWLFWATTLAMAALFYTPFRLPFAVDVAWVALLAPVLVVAGAGARLPPPLAAGALVMGELSYPIYALHYPIFCWVNGVYQIAFKRQDAAVESVAVALAVGVGSLAALHWIDKPARRWLSRRTGLRPSA